MNVLVSSWCKVPDHAIFVIIHSFLFYKTFAWKIGRLEYFDYRFSIIDYNSKVEAHHMAIAKVAFVSFFRYDGE